MHTLAAIEAEIETIRAGARQFTLVERVLYRKGRLATADEVEGLRVSLARFEDLVRTASERPRDG